MRPGLRAAALGLLAALAAAPAVAAPPRVAADIAPVHSLVARVMQGVGQPALVMPPGASPHGHAMRPSEARSLAEAELVVWVGPALAPALGRAIGTLAPGAEVVTLRDLPGMRLLALRTQATFGPHDHAEDGDHGAEDAGHADPHLWLDPLNGATAAEAVADALARLDPGNGPRYAANAAAARAELEALTREIDALLAPLRGRAFVVFHDAYHYFEARFGVEAAGAVSLSDATGPGAGRIGELREHLAALGPACLFTEPQFPPRVARTVAEGLELRLGTLDPLGTTLAPGPDLYAGLLRALARDLADCLTRLGPG